LTRTPAVSRCRRRSDIARSTARGCAPHRSRRGRPRAPDRRDRPRGDRGAADFDVVLQRDFEAAAPNVKWVADFTYIDTAEGWLYVAAVLDLGGTTQAVRDSVFRSWSDLLNANRFVGGDAVGRRDLARVEELSSNLGQQIGADAARIQARQRGKGTTGAALVRQRQVAQRQPRVSSR